MPTCASFWNENAIKVGDIQKELVGKTIVRVNYPDVLITDDIFDGDAALVELYTDDGSVYGILHIFESSESADFNYILGKINDIIDSPLLFINKTISHQEIFDSFKREHFYYKFSTRKGYTVFKFTGTCKINQSINIDIYKGTL